MRTEAELRAKLAELEADDRLTKYKSASTFSNAPLALIQMSGRAQIDLLRWALGEPPFKYPGE